MGILSFFADKGSIGSTTKWAIDLFKSKPKDRDNLTHLREMINARYITNPLERAENFFNDKLDILFERWGLCGVVIKILVFEAELDQNDNAVVDEMLKPLLKRMLKENDIDFVARFGNKERQEYYEEEEKLILAIWGSELVFTSGDLSTY